MHHESDTVRILQKAMCATCLVSSYWYTALYTMNNWMNWNPQCLKSNWTGDVMTTIRDIVYICRYVSFFDKYSTPRNISRWLSDMLTILPVFNQMFRLSFVSCFDTHKTRRYPSASQQEIPCLSTSFTIYFQTSETYISLLPSVFYLVIIFDSTWINKCNKSHLRYYPTYDSQYNKSAFSALKNAKCTQFFPVELRVRKLLPAEYSVEDKR